MRLWEHIHRLNHSDGILLLKEGQVARLSGRITAHIDHAWNFKLQEALDHLGVHAVAWGVRNQDVGFAIALPELGLEGVSHVAHLKVGIGDAVFTGIFLGGCNGFRHGLNANDFFRHLGHEERNRARSCVEVVDRVFGADVGELQGLGVESMRLFRVGLVETLHRPHPRVVFLSNAAVAAPHLPEWLDQLEAEGRPIILCVGASDTPAPQVPHKMAQRRIDLLAIEQNAWVLAARDKRCVVVSTRTELDWAMRHDRMSVWAPSKIVLDAVDGPSASPRDALALVHWFARAMKAQSMLVIGAEAPVAEDMPLSAIAADVHLLP